MARGGHTPVDTLLPVSAADPAKDVDQSSASADSAHSAHSADAAQAAHYAAASMGPYPILVAVLCSVLIIANIGATKLIAFGPIIVDGGAFLFPLTYIVGDILTEVYGWRAARRAVLTGFAMSILAAATFWLVQISPGADAYENQAAFEAVLGFVPRIVLASVCAFLVGQLLNSYVLVRIKARTKERYLWARLVGSTAVGELADTVVFCTIAFAGIISGVEFLTYVVVGYVYKTSVEVVLLPVSYRVIAWMKQLEPSYALPASDSPMRPRTSTL